MSQWTNSKSKAFWCSDFIADHNVGMPYSGIFKKHGKENTGKAKMLWHWAASKQAVNGHRPNLVWLTMCDCICKQFPHTNDGNWCTPWKATSKFLMAYNVQWCGVSMHPKVKQTQCWQIQFCFWCGWLLPGWSCNSLQAWAGDELVKISDESGLLRVFAYSLCLLCLKRLPSAAKSKAGLLLSY